MIWISEASDKGWLKDENRKAGKVKIVSKSRREDRDRSKGRGSVSTWDTGEKNVVIFISSHTTSTHQNLVIFLPL